MDAFTTELAEIRSGVPGDEAELHARQDRGDGDSGSDAPSWMGGRDESGESARLD